MFDLLAFIKQKVGGGSPGISAPALCGETHTHTLLFVDMKCRSLLHLLAVKQLESHVGFVFQHCDDKTAIIDQSVAWSVISAY